MRRALALLALVALAACGPGRPLTDGERQLATDIFGDGLDVNRVRISKEFVGAPAAARPDPDPPQSEIALRPGVCDRVSPDPPTGPPPGWALYNTIHLTQEFYRADTMPGWPRAILMPHIFLIAHELVHVWQWQNRATTGYRPVRAAMESVLNRDPYFYVPGAEGSFLEYGFEQQASLLEDYFCYAIFDPENPRRAELRPILAPHFRMDRIDARFAR